MLKIAKLGLVAALLSLVSGIAPLVHAQPVILTDHWVGTSFSQSITEPYYGSSVIAYATGSTATLIMAITNTVAAYINVTGAKLVTDWGQNYTSTPSPSPLRVNLNQQRTFTLTFPVPSTSTATNLVLHSVSLTVNYTRPGAIGVQTLSDSWGNFAVYSTDQASAVSLMQQLSPIFGPSGLGCAGFASTFTPSAAQGLTLCQQAAQANSLGNMAYSAGNFTAAKTNFQSALSLYNQALSSTSSQGSSLSLGSTVGGWGTLLLGIGAVIVGIGVVVYAWKRPRELKPMAASTVGR